MYVCMYVCMCVYVRVCTYVPLIYLSLLEPTVYFSALLSQSFVYLTFQSVCGWPS